MVYIRRVMLHPSMRGWQLPRTYAIYPADVVHPKAKSAGAVQWAHSSLSRIPLAVCPESLLSHEPSGHRSRRPKNPCHPRVSRTFPRSPSKQATFRVVAIHHLPREFQGRQPLLHGARFPILATFRRGSGLHHGQPRPVHAYLIQERHPFNRNRPTPTVAAADRGGSSRKRSRSFSRNFSAGALWPGKSSQNNSPID